MSFVQSNRAIAAQAFDMGNSVSSLNPAFSTSETRQNGSFVSIAKTAFSAVSLVKAFSFVKNALSSQASASLQT
ncbi:MAG: hypothetical protein LBC09_06275, partial [Helicobacteraceae bacterium]|nr:hypothetical protein [Helicobacteraceae bacterium]